MLDFNYSIPTKIYFGKGKIEMLGEKIKEYGSRVLLVYGGGSIKKNGVYDAVINSLEKENILFWELSGVKPNPRVSSVREGVEVCRKNRIEVILAVGGGSSIDCAKVIAASVEASEDAWELVLDGRKIKKILPIAAVLTLAATGSEMDAGAVISNMQTNEKLGVGHKDMAPKFSILDPTYTFSVPKNQTAAGTVDIMSHVLEVYFSSTKEAYLQNRLAEGILKTCIAYGRRAMDTPGDYEARANLMWASSLAINGLLSYGKETEWSVHKIEHELSAFYDITHGVGLAILFPQWMRYVLDDNTVDKFVEYGIYVWGIDGNGDKFEIAQKSIEKTEDFFASLDMPAKLKDVGIDEEKLEIMSKQAVRRGVLGQFRPLEAKDVLAICKAAL